jgi:transcriptional regulator of heat shock response
MACSSIVKETFSVMSYLEKEQSKYPPSSTQYKEINNKEQDITRDFIRRYGQLLDSLEAEYAEIVKSEKARADLRTAERDELKQRAIRNSMADITNGLNMMQKTQPRNQTFQINGKIITCTTLNNFTNCN